MWPDWLQCDSVTLGKHRFLSRIKYQIESLHFCIWVKSNLVWPQKSPGCSKGYFSPPGGHLLNWSSNEQCSHFLLHLPVLKLHWVLLFKNIQKPQNIIHSQVYQLTRFPSQCTCAHIFFFLCLLRFNHVKALTLKNIICCCSFSYPSAWSETPTGTELQLLQGQLLD